MIIQKISIPTQSLIVAYYNSNKYEIQFDCYFLAVILYPINNRPPLGCINIVEKIEP